MRTRFLLIPVLLVLLSACRGAAYRDYHFTEPVDYYYFFPEGAGSRGPAPLVIALLGEKRSPLDCIELFQQFAVDRRYALLCPDLGGDKGLADPLQAERDLAAILTKLYSTETFQNRFFLIGFGDGGSFALDYALRYPQAVGGVSAMSVETYPENFAPPGPLPVQLLAGEQDQEGLAAAQAVGQTWLAQGLLVRVVPVEGNGRSPSQAFARFSSELVDELSG